MKTITVKITCLDDSYDDVADELMYEDAVIQQAQYSLAGFFSF